MRPERESLRVLFRGAVVDETAALRERIVELEEEVAAAGRPGYVLFVHAPEGFSIVECRDEPPQVGQVLLLPEGAFVVAAVRHSPFPRDDRLCLVAEPA